MGWASSSSFTLFPVYLPFSLFYHPIEPKTKKELFPSSECDTSCRLSERGSRGVEGERFTTLLIQFRLKLALCLEWCTLYNGLTAHSPDTHSVESGRLCLYRTVQQQQHPFFCSFIFAKRWRAGMNIFGSLTK